MIGVSEYCIYCFWYGGYIVLFFVLVIIKFEKKNEVDKVWLNGSLRLKLVNYEVYLFLENYNFKILILYNIFGIYICIICKYYVSIKN